jgi:hypothetical protein
MAWQLEIHHIDVIGSGDATLIVAQEVPPLAGMVAQVRSALVDGGRIGHAAFLDGFITARLGAGVELNVMICTHYDIDHVGGLSGLLRRPNTYDNVIIYDQGWPGGLTHNDESFRRYLLSINGLTPALAALPGLGAINRTWVTDRVMSDNMVPFGPPAWAVPAAPINRAASWLLTAAAPLDVLWWPLATPAGAPSMRIIAANRYVETAAGGILGPVGPAGGGATLKNRKSLAVEVTFGNFRYYVGGDIETPQEDQIQLRLNNADNALGRCLAMKTSHHGANTATSRNFVNQLRPAAAFMSCGTGNNNHPAQQTVNVMDGYLALALPHGAQPPLPPFRPVDYYLTGYLLPGPPPLTYGGDTSLTAGDPNAVPRIFGDIELDVTAAESGVDPRGQLYFAVQAAVNRALTAPGLVGTMGAAAAAPFAVAAAEAAVVWGSNSVASRTITAAGGPAAAGIAADNAANGPIPAGDRANAMANVVTAAALPLTTQAIAAAAGAAAGACYGRATNVAVRRATRRAMITAGLPWAAAAPLAAAAAAALPAAPTQFSVALYDFYAAGGPANVVEQQR